MFKMHCKFTTDKGTLAGGSVVDKKTLKKHFSQDEIEGYIEEGLISEIKMPETTATQKGGEEEMTLEQMIESPKSSLKSAQLNAVCESYGLDTDGNMPERIKRIESFEALLDSDLSELDEEELNQVAVYYGVDTGLDETVKIQAIEEASA